MSSLKCKKVVEIVQIFELKKTTNKSFDKVLISNSISSLIEINQIHNKNLSIK